MRPTKVGRTAQSKDARPRTGRGKDAPYQLIARRAEILRSLGMIDAEIRRLEGKL